MSKKKLTRREFLRVAGAAAGATVVAACQPPGTPAPPAAAKPPVEPTKPPVAVATTAPVAPTKAPVATAVPAAKPAVTYAVAVDTKPAKFSESPMLADLVKAGKLPPVEKRLPEDVLVIKPIEIGQYGGTIRMGTLTAGSTGMRGADQVCAGGWSSEPPMRISPDASKPLKSGVCKDVKISDDKKTYTLIMRKGMKWSDGEPFTSRDFMFWYEDILQNKDINPSIHPGMRPGGKLMEVTAPDDYTVVIKFVVSHPVFELSYLAHPGFGWYMAQFWHPFHYLKQFHPKYNPKADEEAKAAKYESWQARFSEKADSGANKDLPTIAAFYPKTPSSTGVLLERNPYFWQVDTEGNQLPYVDYQQMEYVPNPDMYTTKVVTGAYDFAIMNTTFLNYQAYEKAAEAGNYKIKIWSTGRGGECYYNVNLADKDPVLRKIHQDVRYRRALSLAINRDEINNLVFLGKGVPRQMTVLRSSKYFKPEYEKSWAQYDVAQANALLDEMGLKWDANKKLRLRPDGKPLTYNFPFWNAEGPKQAVTEIVADNWRKVGIDIQIKAVTAQLLAPTITANEQSMSLWHGDASTDVLFPMDRKWHSATFSWESTMAPPWGNWYNSEGKEGEEPPAWFKEVFNAFKEFSETLDPKAAAKLLSLQAENVWSIGTVGETTPHPAIVRKNLFNMPEFGYVGWDTVLTYPYHLETLFFKK